MTELTAKGEETMTPKQRAEQVVIDYNVKKYPSDGITLSMAMEQAIAAAVAEEREACKDIVRTMTAEFDTLNWNSARRAGLDIAAAIEARSHA